MYYCNMGFPKGQVPYDTLELKWPILLWNELSDELKNEMNYVSFKEKLKDYLLKL